MVMLGSDSGDERAAQAGESAILTSALSRLRPATKTATGGPAARGRRELAGHDDRAARPVSIRRAAHRFDGYRERRERIDGGDFHARHTVCRQDAERHPDGPPSGQAPQLHRLAGRWPRRSCGAHGHLGGAVVPHDEHHRAGVLVGERRDIRDVRLLGHLRGGCGDGRQLPHADDDAQARPPPSPPPTSRARTTGCRTSRPLAALAVAARTHGGIRRVLRRRAPASASRCRSRPHPACGGVARRPGVRPARRGVRAMPRSWRRIDGSCRAMFSKRRREPLRLARRAWTRRRDGRRDPDGRAVFITARLRGTP